MENKLHLTGLHLTIVDDNGNFLDSTVELLKDYFREQYPLVEIRYFDKIDEYRKYRATNVKAKPEDVVILGFTDPKDFWEYAQKGGRLEIVLMDYTFHNSKKTGYQWVEDFFSKFEDRHESIGFIMTTARYDNDTVIKAILAGVSGYYCKHDKIERLFEVIDQVRKGNPNIIEDIRQFYWKQNENTNVVLSEIQRKVLGLVASGMTSTEIADDLKKSVAAVNKTLQKIYRKLNVNSEKQAILKYYGQSWLLFQEVLVGEHVIEGKIPGIRVIISPSGGKERSIQLIYDVEIVKFDSPWKANLANALTLAISTVERENIDLH